MNKKYTYAWIAWILMFGVIEFAAIQDKREGDTLTEHVRAAIGTAGPRQWINWVARVGLGVLFAWLIPHFFTGSV